MDPAALPTVACQGLPEHGVSGAHVPKAQAAGDTRLRDYGLGACELHLLLPDAASLQERPASTPARHHLEPSPSTALSAFLAHLPQDKHPWAPGLEGFLLVLVFTPTRLRFLKVGDQVLFPFCTEPGTMARRFPLVYPIIPQWNVSRWQIGCSGFFFFIFYLNSISQHAV